MVAGLFVDISAGEVVVLPDNKYSDGMNEST